MTSQSHLTPLQDTEHTIYVPTDFSVPCLEGCASWAHLVILTLLNTRQFNTGNSKAMLENSLQHLGTGTLRKPKLHQTLPCTIHEPKNIFAYYMLKDFQVCGHVDCYNRESTYMYMHAWFLTNSEASLMH